jgi:hypothetical protein
LIALFANESQRDINFEKEVKEDVSNRHVACWQL